MRSKVGRVLPSRKVTPSREHAIRVGGRRSRAYRLETPTFPYAESSSISARSQTPGARAPFQIARALSESPFNTPPSSSRSATASSTFSQGSNRCYGLPGRRRDPEDLHIPFFSTRKFHATWSPFSICCSLASANRM